MTELGWNQSFSHKFFGINSYTFIEIFLISKKLFHPIQSRIVKHFIVLLMGVITASDMIDIVKLTNVQKPKKWERMNNHNVQLQTFEHMEYLPKKLIMIY